MDIQIIQQLAIMFAVAFGALLIALGALYVIRSFRRAAQPGTDAILAALEPWALKAIYGAEALALSALSSAHITLEGLDKKAIADNQYALLPSTISIGGRSFPIGFVKSLVSKTQWEQLVQRVFDEADARVSQNAEWLKKQIGLIEQPSADPIRPVTVSGGQVTPPFESPGGYVAAGYTPGGVGVHG